MLRTASRSRRAARLLLAGLALATSGLVCPGPPVTDLLVAPLQARGRVWARFETWGALPDVANPFDPAQADVWGEFEDPDGQIVRMPGFYTREFTRRLVGGFEKLAPAREGYFAVRFTPTRAGRWRWRWTATTAAGTQTTPWHDLDVDPPAPEAHGFLRVSPQDSRYLRFDDGTPYLAIGENLCWYDGRGTFAYDDWLEKLAAQGVNYIRLWMPSWAFGLEWIRRDNTGAIVSNTLGNYGDRLDRAWQLDHVLRRAEELGIYVMLSVQYHGAFSLTANVEWGDNPYNAANGGPLTQPNQILTDPTARELFERRLRYVVARWGYSPNVLAFEFWNELNLVAPQHGGPSSLAWHQEMAAVIDAFDPYDHLLTTSLSATVPSALWSLPEIDFTQMHFYAYPVEVDFQQAIPQLLPAVRVPGKPVLVGENGVDWRGPAETQASDPTAVGFHDALWTGVLAETFGTSMTWWWDNWIDPNDLYFHFGPVATFVEGIAFDAQGFQPGGATAAAPGRSLGVLALRGRTVALAWIKNQAHQWFPTGGGGLDPSVVAGASLALDGLADGVWRARWIDTYTGADLAVEDAIAAGGGLVLAAPDFAKDVALRLEWVQPAASAALRE
jgi:hypothetical protein